MICPHFFMPPPLGAGGIMFSGCPSVRPSVRSLKYRKFGNLGFPGISQRTHRGNGLKFCMLMYLDHLHNWLVLGHGLLGQYRVKFGVSGHFLENAWRELPEIWYTAVCWPKFGVSRHFLETHLGNGLKFCMLMYPEHLQNWLDYGYSL